MTGAYVRINRDGIWINKEIEFLTNDEREEFFKSRENRELIRWINTLCNTIEILLIGREYEPR